ncbi:hypothetical protein O3M35_009625 [Rhynocoris fuscipes]|uniref:Uncharacterized protein n=1 Tax=Rhynocoris fuscipes TaxID=488301 RepID=A0AAW1DAK9_9HEMI
MIRATERRRRSLKRDSSYLQKILRIPQNSIVARGVTNITYFSKKPENVFPKKPNYLKYFPRKILKFPVPVYQMRKLSLKDLDSVSSYSSDTVINFEINSDLEVEFKKEVRHYLEYRGIGEQQRFVDPPTLSSSEISEDTDSSFFSTQISSLTSCIPTRRDTPSSPITTKDQDSSYISLPNIKPKFPSESSLISDVEEEALQEEEEEALQEEQITEPHLSDVSCGSKLPFSHPLDRYSEHKKSNFVDIVNTSTKRSRTDLRHLFPDFSGLNFAKSIDKMNKIEDSIKALSCEEIIPGEDVSDLSSVQWLPFTRGQTKFGKEVLHKGGELFKSISSHTFIGRKMKKSYRPPSSDSRILVKDSGSGLSPDALEDHRKRPVVRYNFKLDGILSEEAMLKNSSKAKGKISELSLNTILGIY